MREEIKDSLVKIGLVWLFVGTALSIPPSCCKAVSAFYKQVIANTPSDTGEPRVIVK